MQKKALHAETIDGYYVHENMKKVWAVELDLLKQFIAICKKYDLPYYMAGGSLLGVVRHKGFIPWDDDIDVDMKREDYEKFIAVAGKELRGKYSLQTTYNEAGYARPHIQIRNAETTAILENEVGLHFNQGIFIDIFPLDAAPANGILRRIHAFIISYLMNFLRAGVMVNPKYNKSKFKVIAHYIAKPFFVVFDYRKVFAIFEKICTYFNENDNFEIGEISFDYQDRCIWQRSWFDETVEMPFEDIYVSCPKGYDEVLTKTFGDYMVPCQAPSYHGNVMFDAEKNYHHYLKKED